MTKEIATLAGGCFWCLEAVFDQLAGVECVESGYMGGHVDNPTYQDVCTGATGHAEVVQITYDESRLTFRDILEVFFALHDPTTLNRQGNDQGTQYRSAIFFTNEAQQKVAEAVKARVDKSGQWKKPVVTEIVAASTWYPAEDYHQDYLQKHPSGYTCHFMRD